MSSKKPTTTIQQQQQESKVDENELFNSIVAEIYNLDVLSENDLILWWKSIEYQGFNRNQVVIDLKKIIPDPQDMVRLIILIAVRGPQKSSTFKLASGKSPVELGIPASGGKGSKKITCGKIGAATADLAAFYLKKMKFPKRLNMELPGWLQFPAAGSIKLPENFREQHRLFSVQFSAKIKGSFNEDIYLQMMNNAYLAPNLNLF
jgi:hypothetical protein